MIQQEDDIDAILDLMLQRMRMSKDFNKPEQFYALLHFFDK